MPFFAPVAAWRRTAYRLAMTPRRPPRPRASLLVGGLLLLLVAAAAGIALVVRPAVAVVPLDPTIPNGHLLIARGLSGVPDPGQPTTPIAVDRVVTDGTTTYVQFHTSASATRPGGLFWSSFSPRLSDDTGTLVTFNWVLSSASPQAPLPALPFPVPSWFPWSPSVVTRGTLVLGPLPPTARAAVLRFDQLGRGVGTGETVRIPLNLAALRQRRAYTGPLVRRAGLELRVAAARDTSLVLGYELPDDLTSGVFLNGVTLRDARGRAVPRAVRVSDECASGGLPDVGLMCREVWAYPPQPHGARLTLTIRSFTSDTLPAGPIGPGPWRLSVIIP